MAAKYYDALNPFLGRSFGIQSQGVYVNISTSFNVEFIIVI